MAFSVDDAVHDLHLSKTDVHYKTELKAIQITVHTFIDDTEEALMAKDSLAYKFFESTEHVATDSIFGAYLKEKLIITVNGVQQDFLYLGKEQSEDIQGIYTYLEIEEITTVDEVEVQNSILTEMFDDQRNIINFKVDNKSKAFHILSKTDTLKHIKL